MRRFIHAGHYHGMNYYVECHDGVNVFASVIINNEEWKESFTLKNLAFDWVRKMLSTYDKSISESMEQYEIERDQEAF